MFKKQFSEKVFLEGGIVEKVVNMGSMNLDKVYLVEKFVAPGETVHALQYSENCGGKGLNQSIAMARAGVYVYHAGKVGKEGVLLMDYLKKSGVDISFLEEVTAVNGHAVIQVDQNGQNSIVVCKGSNDLVEKEYIIRVLDQFCSGDILVLQNEISNVDFAITEAKERGLKVVFNPSPVNDAVFGYRLGDVDCFILNEIEAAFLADVGEFDMERIIHNLLEKYPQAAFVMTLGEKGSCYFDRSKRICQDIFQVEAVDTTGAGDTFCGYYIAAMLKGLDIQKRLYIASAASAIAVGRNGAAQSIPCLDEVTRFLADGERGKVI